MRTIAKVILAVDLFLNVVLVTVLHIGCCTATPRPVVAPDVIPMTTNMNNNVTSPGFDSETYIWDNWDLHK